MPGTAATRLWPTVKWCSEMCLASVLQGMAVWPAMPDASEHASDVQAGVVPSTNPVSALLLLAQRQLPAVHKTNAGDLSRVHAGTYNLNGLSSLSEKN